jgi:hypothetical protein
MIRTKNLLEQKDKFTKYVRAYMSNRDYAMADYYSNRLKYIERELEIEKIQRAKNKKEERKLKEKNNEIKM